MGIKKPLVSLHEQLLRDEPAPRATARQLVTALDVAGIAGFALAMTGLLLFLSSLPRANWPLLGITVALWAAELGWELAIDSEDFCAYDGHFWCFYVWPQSSEEYGSRHYQSHPVQLLASILFLTRYRCLCVWQKLPETKRSSRVACLACCKVPS